jgi:hypothetical protein
MRILRKHGVKHCIGNLVCDFIWVTLRNAFGSEQMSHWDSLLITGWRNTGMQKDVKNTFFAGEMPEEQKKSDC